MILKSYEIENNVKEVFKFKFILIYGENIGLKESLKKKIIKFNNQSEVINLYQEDIAKQKDIITNEIKNISLFAKEKIIIVNQTDEKILYEIEKLVDSEENVKIILIADLLDKRSKLRSFFEKKTKLAIIPCYKDTEITLKRLVQKELREFKNLDSNAISMLLNYSNLNRKTIINNIEKIKSFYEKKIISEETLEILLNSDRNEMFENIRDAALFGDKTKLNSLIGNFSFALEDSYLYLNMINFRLTKLLDIHRLNENIQSFEVAINQVKPPIFWKDKSIFVQLLKKWDKQRVLDALKYLGRIEKKIKSNGAVNSLTLVKNSVTNICSNSWTYF